MTIFDNAFFTTKDFAYSTVAVAPSPDTSGTSLEVAAGEGVKFPAPGTAGVFRAYVYPATSRPDTTNCEEIEVTVKSTDTFTIVRAKNGVSRAIVVGDRISINFGKSKEDQLTQAIKDGVFEDKLLPGESYSRDSVTQFKTPGDKTTFYTKGRILRINNAGSYTIHTVVSSSYSAPDTTVIVTDGALPAALTNIYVGIQPKGYLKRQVIYDVRDYGAKGDGVTDDTAAIQAAFDAATSSGYNSITYFPKGNYLISNSINLNGAGGYVGGYVVRGESREAVQVITTTNIPMFKLDLDVAQNYYSVIENITFVGNVSGTRTSNDGILITGSANNLLAYSQFRNLMFLGTYIGIHSNKSTNSIGENMLNFCQFYNMIFANNGALNNEYGIKFDYGSGTGNIFDNMVIGAVTSCIEMGGTGDVNVGDLIFTNIQTNTAQNGIKLTKGSTAYGSNIVVSQCQFDAGVVNGINFTNMNGFRITNINWADWVGCLTPGCANFHIDQVDTQCLHQVQDTGIGIGATTDLFSLTLPAYSAVFIEVNTYGFLQGRGQAIVTTTYQLYSDGTPNLAISQIATNGTGSGTITHSTSISGAVCTFKAAINSTNAGSNLCTVARIIGGGLYTGYQFAKV